MPNYNNKTLGSYCNASYRAHKTADTESSVIFLFVKILFF